MRDLREPRDELVAQRADFFCVFVNVRARLFKRGRHCHDAGDIFCARALAALLRAALDEVRQEDAALCIQQTHALRTVELVRREGEHINVLRLHVDVQMSRRLHGVGVEQHALFLADRADLGDGEDRADLIVRVHDGDKAGILADGVRHLLRRDRADRTDVQKLDLKAFFFELFQRMQHRVMLKRCGNDVFFAFFRAHQRRRADRLIVRLAAAGGKIDLLWVAVEQPRAGRARVLQRFVCFLTDGVEARRVAVDIFHCPGHGFNRGGAHFGRCRIISINCHLIHLRFGSRRFSFFHA